MKKTISSDNKCVQNNSTINIFIQCNSNVTKLTLKCVKILEEKIYEDYKDSQWSDFF